MIRHTRSDRDWSSDVCSSDRSEEHTSELQSRSDLVCRLLLVTGVQTCALPIDRKSTRLNSSHDQISYAVLLDKKNTRLNSSHDQISYAVFCLRKKMIVEWGGDRYLNVYDGFDAPMQQHIHDISRGHVSFACY